MRISRRSTQRSFDIVKRLRIPTKPPGYNGIMPPGIPE
jgi:hypothetical protein